MRIEIEKKFTARIEHKKVRVTRVTIHPTNKAERLWPPKLQEQLLKKELEGLRLRLTTPLEFLTLIHQWRLGDTHLEGIQCLIDMDSPEKPIKKYLRFKTKKDWPNFLICEVRYCEDPSKYLDWVDEVLCLPI